MKTSNLDKITEALLIAQKTGHPKAEHIQQAFNALTFDDKGYQNITPAITLPEMPEITRGADRYNDFFKTEMTS